MIKKKISKNHSLKLAIAGGVAGVILIAALYASPKTSTLDSTKTPQSPSPSPTATALAQPGAGKPAARGADPTPTAAPAQVTSAPRAILKPIGQLLNKTTISLSAPSYDGMRNSSMVSTVHTATPGSSKTLIATSASGTKITIGSPITADANGQGTELSWNAKTSGLRPGKWQIQIQSQLNGSGALSDAELLTVEE